MAKIRKRGFEIRVRPGAAEDKGAATGPKRAAVYARVSTEDQAKEGYSLDAQVERLSFYAKSQGWEIVGPFVDDGYSGRDIDRPAYARIMDSKEKWDVLLVYKMDRIHRSSKNFIMMMDNLKRWGKDFVSATESLDTSTAMGRFVMDIIQRIAQLESEQIGERTFMGMRQKVETDLAPIGGSITSFGYRWSKPSKSKKKFFGGQPVAAGKGSGTWVVVPAEAAIVRRVFQEIGEGKAVRDVAKDVLGGCTCTRIARRQVVRHALKDGTIKEYKYNRDLYSECTNCSKVRRIIRNPTYLGYFVWGKKIYKGPHKAIIDRKMWDRAQAQIAKRARGQWVRVALPA